MGPRAKLWRRARESGTRRAMHPVGDGRTATAAGPGRGATETPTAPTLQAAANRGDPWPAGMPDAFISRADELLSMQDAG